MVSVKYKTWVPGRKLWATCIIMFIIMLLSWQAYQYPKTTVMQELMYHAHRMQAECGQFQTQTNLDINRNEINGALDGYFSAPNCANLLTNITQGKWKNKHYVSSKLFTEIKEIHKEYRLKVGIPLTPWRDDKRCGFSVQTHRVSIDWPQTASFCDPEGSTPCCTDSYKGKCIAIDTNHKCDCPQCLDVREYKEALFAHWTTKDSRCIWKNYTELEACAVLNRLSNQRGVAEFHFVGDSLMRNMFMGLSSILTGDLTRGIHRMCVTKELKEICLGENLFVFRPCHDLVAAHSLEQLNRIRTLCGGHRHFRALYHGIGMPNQAEDLMKLVQKLKNKENQYIIMGVGLHFLCDHEQVIREFLEPIINFLKYSKRTWPRIVWVHPLSVGLLKPPAFFQTQSDEAIAQFVKKIQIYLQKHNIPILDFRQVTKRVHSYDGTHYGAGVNMIKAQVLLNYFATIAETI